MNVLLHESCTTRTLIAHQDTHNNIERETVSVRVKMKPHPICMHWHPPNSKPCCMHTVGCVREHAGVCEWMRISCGLAVCIQTSMRIHTYNALEYLCIHIPLFNLYAAHLNHAYEWEGKLMAQTWIQVQDECDACAR